MIWESLYNTSKTLIGYGVTMDRDNLHWHDEETPTYCITVYTRVQGGRCIVTALLRLRSCLHCTTLVGCISGTNDHEYGPAHEWTLSKAFIEQQKEYFNEYGLLSWREGTIRTSSTSWSCRVWYPKLTRLIVTKNGVVKDSALHIDISACITILNWHGAAPLCTVMTYWWGSVAFGVGAPARPCFAKYLFSEWFNVLDIWQWLWFLEHQFYAHIKN